MVGPRRQAGRRPAVRPRDGGLPRHVPALAGDPEADHRDGAGRVHRGRADARVGVRPDRGVRRRVLRRSGGADGHPGRRVLRAPVGARPARSPRSSCSPATGSPRSAPTSWAWSTGSCRATSWSARRSRSPDGSPPCPGSGWRSPRRRSTRPRTRWACAPAWTRCSACTTSRTRTTPRSAPTRSAGMDATVDARLPKSELSGSRPRRRDRRFRDEVRDWLADERARRTAAVDGHRGGLRGAPRVGAHARRRPAVGGVLAARVRRAGRVAAGVGGVRGGVLRRRRARAGQPERHLPARARPCSRTAPPSSGPDPAADGARRRDLGAGLVRARGGQRPRRRSAAGAGAPTAAGCSRAEDVEFAGGASRTGRSACSAATRHASGTAG